jgi:hypothetical protein
MKLNDRPLRLILKRIGHFEFPLPVNTIAEAQQALLNWQGAQGLRDHEVCYPHGCVTRGGEVVARIAFGGQVRT